MRAIVFLSIDSKCRDAFRGEKVAEAKDKRRSVTENFHAC